MEFDHELGQQGAVERLIETTVRAADPGLLLMEVLMPVAQSILTDPESGHILVVVQPEFRLSRDGGTKVPQGPIVVRRVCGARQSGAADLRLGKARPPGLPHGLAVHELRERG